MTNDQNDESHALNHQQELEQMQTTIPHVYAAIASVTKKLSEHGIAKDRSNQQQGYKFRGIDDIYNALAPMLAEARLCILPRVLNRTVTERATRNGGTVFYVVSDVEYDFVSADDGSKHTIRVCGEAMDSGDKATNKAMSAAYKYACLQAFCIPTEGDNDADATTHQIAPAAQRKQMPEAMALEISKLLDAANPETGEGVDAFGEAWIAMDQDEQISFSPWIGSLYPQQVSKVKAHMHAVMRAYRGRKNQTEEAAA